VNAKIRSDEWSFMKEEQDKQIIDRCPTPRNINPLASICFLFTTKIVFTNFAPISLHKAAESFFLLQQDSSTEERYF